MSDPALAAARREAGEALRNTSACRLTHEDNCICGFGPLIPALRSLLAALLAAGPEAPPPPSDAVREAAEAIARRLFGSREHVALWDAINEFREAPNLIAREHAVVRVEDGLRAVILAALASPPAAPARDEVREAAEVIRTILTAHDARLSESGVLTYGPPSKGTGFVAAIQWLRRYDAARGGE